MSFAFNCSRLLGIVPPSLLIPSSLPCPAPISEYTRSYPTDAPDSIISRTIHKDVRVKVVLFDFAVGQSLSEHSYKAESGAWMYISPHLKHSVTTKSLLVMQLVNQETRMMSNE
ncbi:MAG: hypothetical protein JNJ61_18725 [Anaerolineae bacterium]|nr:hypothetical protein [Anaerolineae bacterium]